MVVLSAPTYPSLYECSGQWKIRLPQFIVPESPELKKCSSPLGHWRTQEPQEFNEIHSVLEGDGFIKTLLADLYLAPLFPEWGYWDHIINAFDQWDVVYLYHPLWSKFPTPIPLCSCRGVFSDKISS